MPSLVSQQRPQISIPIYNRHLWRIQTVSQCNQVNRQQAKAKKEFRLAVLSPRQRMLTSTRTSTLPRHQIRLRNCLHLRKPTPTRTPTAIERHRRYQNQPRRPHRKMCPPLLHRDQKGPKLSLLHPRSLHPKLLKQLANSISGDGTLHRFQFAFRFRASSTVVKTEVLEA